MNTDYSTFNYNDDFTPIYNVFNVNTANKRFVGIGTHNPNEFLDIIGNVSTTNLFVQKNIYYNNTTSDNLLNNFQTNTNKIHLFSLDNNKRIIAPNLVSTNFEETGIEWSIVNNNNIKLTLRNINDNTRLHYNSDFFNIENIFSKNIDLYLNSTVTLKYLYITETDNSSLPINLTSNSINNINSNIINNNITITISDNSNDNKITKLIESTNSLFKFENFITLSKGVYNFNITGLNGFTIQFIGTYDYYAGSLWNKSNSTVTILKNVGIGTSNISNNLDILGNTVFTSNLHINKKLTTNVLNSSQLNINGYVNVNKIEPIQNSLIINPYKTPIGIGSKNPNDFLDIGNNFKINSNGNIILHNLNFSHPNNLSLNNASITLSDNIAFLHNNSSITINNSNTFNNFNNSITDFKLNNKTILNDSPSSMQLFSKLSINDISSTSTNESSDLLYVNGNINIYGDLTANIDKTDFIHNPITTHLNNSINTQNTIVSDLLHSEGFLYTDTLESTSININKYFNLPIQVNDIPLHDYSYIYYNQTTNKYMIYNSNNPNNNSYPINTDTSLMDFSNIVEIFTHNASQINFIHTKDIKTNILENNKSFHLDSAQLYYNVNLNNSEIIVDDILHCFDLF